MNPIARKPDFYLPANPRPVVATVPKVETMVGLDLGQLTDFSAASAVERSVYLDAEGNPRRTSLGRLIRRYDVRALRRFDLGTPYTTIVDRMAERLRMLPGARLCIDATGVGRPIVDMFRELRIEVYAVTITGGNSWSNPSYNEYRVSKIELVAAIRTALEQERLKVSGGVNHSDVLKKELQNFKVKISKSENEIYSAREGDHDDLALSIAIPLWVSWMLDNTRPFIAGARTVATPSIRNPLQITANLAGLFGRRQSPSIIGESHGQRQLEDRRKT
jgi:hypothetical protein